MKFQKRQKKIVKQTPATMTDDYQLYLFKTIRALNNELDNIHNYIEKECKKLNKLYSSQFIPFTNSLVEDIKTNAKYYKNDSKKIEKLLREWYLIWLRYTTNVDFLLDGFTESCGRDFYMYKVNVDNCPLISFTNGERSYANTMELSASSAYFISNTYNQKDLYVPHLYSPEHKEPDLQSMKDLHENNELKANQLAGKLDELRLNLLQQEPISSLKNCLSKSLGIKFVNDFSNRNRTITLSGILTLTLSPSSANLTKAKEISEGAAKVVQLYERALEYRENATKKRRLFKGSNSLFLISF